LTDTPIDTDDLPLMTEDEILARFYRLNTTIGLTRTQFGYTSCGTPGIIKRIEMGKKLHQKTRRQLTAMLHRIEAMHSEPVPATNIPLA
jgi:hypothetical protein